MATRLYQRSRTGTPLISMDKHLRAGLGKVLGRTRCATTRPWLPVIVDFVAVVHYQIVQFVLDLSNMITFQVIFPISVNAFPVVTPSIFLSLFSPVGFLRKVIFPNDSKHALRRQTLQQCW